MTKLRAPLSFEDALVEVASVLGYQAMSEIAGVQPRTVRKWGDPEAPERCPVEAALEFDIAYQQAGGEGAPLYEAYGALIEATRAQRFSDEAAIARAAIKVIKEGGEAHAALVALSQPGATDADRRAAAKEVQEARAALDQTLPLLTKGIGPNGTNGERQALMGGQA